MMKAMGFIEVKMKKKIWVQVKPSKDPGLKGKAIARKYKSPHKIFTETPEEVEVDAAIERMINKGLLIEVDSPECNNNDCLEE